ncbi:MAG: fatty acyl-AMP ligase [Proteobacteria bacterium]|nr:fatty acyl-AMP ligase [Pseudomonadota bacterium]
MFETINEIFDDTAARYPATSCSFPLDKTEVSMESLVAESRRYAAGLAEQGIAKGDLVGLLFPTSIEFMYAFFGLLRLGAVPTALPLPASAADLATFGQRVQRIIDDGGVRHVLIHKRFAPLAAAPPRGVHMVAFDEQLAAADNTNGFDVRGDDLAFVQYTSGSTSAPKGVALRHANIAAGLRAIRESSRLGPSDRLMQWLPLYHDMGLFGMLAALSSGAPVHVWPPTSFIRKPRQWLQEFSKVRATLYTGPNFSYEYLLRAFSDKDLDGLELSNWRLAYNGAEHINHESTRRFIEFFGRCGFRAEAMFPVYGLAEATLAVSFPVPGRPPRTQWVERDLLANQGHAKPCERDHPDARPLVSVGNPVLDHEVRICDRDGRVLPEQQAGEIQIRGPAVMRGYLNQPEATEATFQDGWLKTGDLGYFSEGELYITGRQKEFIIVNGQNYYPQDVEDIAREVPGVYRNRCIAVALYSEGDERMGVLAETDLSDDEELAALASSIQQTILHKLSISNVDVHLVARRTIKRTTSGKYQRILMARHLLDNELGDELRFSLRVG